MGVYEWIKSIHVISIIAWMAGMLYLPRLFVYHAETEIGSEKSETFKVMERRLLKAIINPAMISAWIFGLWTAYEIGAFSDGWFHAKLTLVILMSAVHGYLSGCVKRFARDENKKSAKFYRFLNEVPTVLMIFIVILVIGKPF
ncbi:protoporphyrinogen oxidase HemJ [Roseibium sp.]|uniref:protoporphyrinogen oxidase HemJ n=1 Tax=Roseibium sp. TaxID=1936156 RepID=UPI003A96D174